MRYSKGDTVDSPAIYPFNTCYYDESSLHIPMSNMPPYLLCPLTHSHFFYHTCHWHTLLSHNSPLTHNLPPLVTRVPLSLINTPSSLLTLFSSHPLLALISHILNYCINKRVGSCGWKRLVGSWRWCLWSKQVNPSNHLNHLNHIYHLTLVHHFNHGTVIWPSVVNLDTTVWPFTCLFTIS